MCIQKSQIADEKGRRMDKADVDMVCLRTAVFALAVPRSG